MIKVKILWSEEAGNHTSETLSNLYEDVLILSNFWVNSVNFVIFTLIMPEHKLFHTRNLNKFLFLLNIFAIPCFLKLLRPVFELYKFKD